MNINNQNIKSENKISQSQSKQAETNSSEKNELSEFDMQMLSAQKQQEQKESKSTFKDEVANLQEENSKELLQAFISNKNIKISNLNQKTLIEKMNFDFSAINSINIKNLTKEDILVFKELTSDKSLNLNGLNENNFQLVLQNSDTGNNLSYKSFDISKTLFNLIEHASKTQKPVRLEFDSNSSVILKIDKEGKISADFLSTDSSMEMALKASLPELKDKFDKENIPYKELNYRNLNKKQQNNNQNQQQNQQGGNLYE